MFIYSPNVLVLFLLLRDRSMPSDSNQSSTSSSSSTSVTPTTSMTSNVTTACVSSRSLSPQQLSSKQLNKLKRFLSTLYHFGSDVSAEIGERVRALILAVVVSDMNPILFAVHLSHSLLLVSSSFY
jgi:hypothetical protein